MVRQMWSQDRDDFHEIHGELRGGRIGMPIQHCWIANRAIGENTNYGQIGIWRWLFANASRQIQYTLDIVGRELSFN
jgi:hypothetical protein